MPILSFSNTADQVMVRAIQFSSCTAELLTSLLLSYVASTAYRAIEPNSSDYLTKFMESESSVNVNYNSVILNKNHAVTG